jgi:secreted Zn-dependent insulinase-like peptidase
MTRDDPDNRFWEAFFATAFREHPYRQPIIGHRDIFAAVSRDDLVGYYQARYVPNNLVVVVVGDIDVAATRAEVERHFGTAPRAKLAPVLVPEVTAAVALGFGLTRLAAGRAADRSSPRRRLSTSSAASSKGCRSLPAPRRPALLNWSPAGS